MAANAQDVGENLRVLQAGGRAEVRRKEDAAGTALEMRRTCFAIGRVQGGESLVCGELQEMGIVF